MKQKHTKKTGRHNANLLIVDDDGLVLATLCLGLRDAGFQVTEASSGEEAIELCGKYDFDLALFDIQLPGLSGIETARIIYETYQVPFLFLSAFSDENIVNEAICQGALGYLVKPINVTQIIPAIETALTRAIDIKSMLAHQDDLTNALSRDRDVSVAIGIFVAYTSYSAKQAETVLRLYSRNTRQKMGQVAKNIIAASEELNTLITTIQSVGDQKNEQK